jgi:hypothetical protein
MGRWNLQELICTIHPPTLWQVRNLEEVRNRSQSSKARPFQIVLDRTPIVSK